MNVWERLNSFKGIISISVLIVLIMGLSVLSFACYKLGNVYSDFIYSMILRRAMLAIVVVALIVYLIKFPIMFYSQITPWLIILGLGCLPYVDIVNDVVAGIQKKDVTVTQLYPVDRGTERSSSLIHIGKGPITSLKYEFSVDGNSERFTIEPALYNKLIVGREYTAYYLGSMKTILDMQQVTNPDEFTGDCRIWLLDSNDGTRCIKVFVLGRVRQEALADIKLGMELFKRFVSEQCNGELRLPLKLVVTENKQLYSQVLEREFRLDKDDVEWKVKNTNWYYKGDTAVIDAGAWRTRKQRIYAVAQFMSKRYLNEVVTRKANQMQWAYVGAGDAVATYIVAMARPEGDLEYKKKWSSEMQKNDEWPELAALVKPDGWDEAYAKYGAVTTKQTASLAVLYLVESKGFRSFTAWYLDANDTGNIEGSFEKIYKISFRDFSDDYNNYVRGIL